MSEPARWGRRRAALDRLDRVHLARPAVHLYELALAFKGARNDRRTCATDGLPLPPARLRAQIGPAHADAAVFLASGRHHADLVRELLREDGASPEELGALLDFGCGCGRVARNWSRLPTTRVCGCDINPKMIGWCRANLHFGDFVVSDLSPPLPYRSSSFDLVYAFSVFTHLDRELQHAWMAELSRTLAPGGYLLVSTLGERYLSLDRLTAAERESFAGGEVVVLYERSPGTSLCSAYHPPRYVHERLGKGLELVAFRPAADDGGHDIHLFRKPSET